MFILIVDDSLPMRKVIKKTTVAAGFSSATFAEAANGSEAMNILKTQKIDMLITGHNMPRMKGLELVTWMKADSSLNAIPVIVVTAEGSRERLKEFMNLAIEGYLLKPFTPEKLCQAIIPCCNQKVNLS